VAFDKSYLKGFILFNLTMSGRKNFPPEIDIYEIMDHVNNKEWGSDEENYTALASAIYFGNVQILRFVLSNEPHQLEILSDGKSPIYIACDLGQLECLKILLSCGANTESRYTRTGGTALYVAAEVELHYHHYHHHHYPHHHHDCYHHYYCHHHHHCYHHYHYN